MRKQLFFTVLSAVMVTVSIQAAVTNLTPAEVHARLVAGDNVLLLDVREWSDYTAGHIAEPVGYLPLTPAWMSYTTGGAGGATRSLAHGYRHHRVLRVREPQCQVVGLPGEVGVFTSLQHDQRLHGLDQGGYEKRTGGFGDRSGSWVRSFQSSVITAPGFVVSSGTNQWIPHAAVVSFPTYSLTENTLHRWYATLGSIAGSAVARGHRSGIAGSAAMAAAPSVLTSVDGKVSHASGHGILVSTGDQSRRVVTSPSPSRR